MWSCTIPVVEQGRGLARPRPRRWNRTGQGSLALRIQAPKNMKGRWYLLCRPGWLREDPGRTSWHSTVVRESTLPSIEKDPCCRFNTTRRSKQPCVGQMPVHSQRRDLCFVVSGTRVNEYGVGTCRQCEQEERK